MDVRGFDFWCKTVILNKARDYYRKRNVDWKKTQLMRTENEGWTDDYFKTNLSVAGMNFTMRDSELCASIKRLPKERETIVLLYYFGGFTDKETGRITNRPTSSIQYNRNKALSMLKKDLMEKRHVKPRYHRQGYSCR